VSAPSAASIGAAEVEDCDAPAYLWDDFLASWRYRIRRSGAASRIKPLATNGFVACESEGRFFILYMLGTCSGAQRAGAASAAAALSSTAGCPAAANHQ